MKTILYKLGLFCIIFTWAVYVCSFVLLLIPGAVMRLFGIKLLKSYAIKFNRWMRRAENKFRDWYVMEAYLSLADFKLDKDEARKLYVTVCSVFTKLECSEEQKTNGLNALWQMIAKDVITKEDFYFQFGNSVQGCGNIMAQSLGFKLNELHEKINLKQLVSSEVLPKFRIELEKAYLS